MMTFMYNDISGMIAFLNYSKTVLCRLQLQPELFGPAHFVGLGNGLGLRLKSEIRTRT
jgi:hypothetical protein